MMGLVLNQFDLYVTNNMINGQQFSTVWYLEDLKLSHLDRN